MSKFSIVRPDGKPYVTTEVTEEGSSVTYFSYPNEKRGKFRMVTVEEEEDYCDSDGYGVRHNMRIEELCECGEGLIESRLSDIESDIEKLRQDVLERPVITEDMINSAVFVKNYVR